VHAQIWSHRTRIPPFSNNPCSARSSVTNLHYILSGLTIRASHPSSNNPNRARSSIINLHYRNARMFARLPLPNTCITPRHNTDSFLSVIINIVYSPNPFSRHYLLQEIWLLFGYSLLFVAGVNIYPIWFAHSLYLVYRLNVFLVQYLGVSGFMISGLNTFVSILMCFGAEILYYFAVFLLVNNIYTRLKQKVLSYFRIHEMHLMPQGKIVATIFIALLWWFGDHYIQLSLTLLSAVFPIFHYLNQFIKLYVLITITLPGYRGWIYLRR